MKKAAMIMMVLGCFVMLQACASAPKLPEATPGLYVNAEHSFTVAYPEKYVAQPLQGDEVFRTANPNPYLIPVLTVSIADVMPMASSNQLRFWNRLRLPFPVPNVSRSCRKRWLPSTMVHPVWR